MYSRNNDIAIRRNRRRTKAIDRKDSIESIPVLCQTESPKFSLCLFSKIISINKKQHSTHWCIRKHSVGSKTSRICFACSSSKNHQRPILPCTETFFKFCHRLILAITKSLPFQGRKSGKCILNPQLLDQFMRRRNSHYLLETRILFTKITTI